MAPRLSRHSTRLVAVSLSRADWTWLERDLIRRQVTLMKYVAQVLEGEIAIQREAQRVPAPHAQGARIRTRIERPVLAVER